MRCYILDDLFYRGSLTVLITVFFIIRAHSARSASNIEKATERKPVRERILVSLNFVGMVGVPFIYIITDWLDSFSFPLPESLRLFGIVFDIAGNAIAYTLSTLAKGSTLAISPTTPLKYTGNGKAFGFSFNGIYLVAVLHQGASASDARRIIVIRVDGASDISNYSSVSMAGGGSCFWRRSIFRHPN